jgi:hypothetical protein
MIEGAALDLSGKLDEARSRYEQALSLDRQREQPGASRRERERRVYGNSGHITPEPAFTVSGA